MLKPITVSCDSELLHVSLSDGRKVSVPLWWYPRLFTADIAARNNTELMKSGIHWPDLDEDLSIESMLRGEKAQGAIDPNQEYENYTVSHSKSGKLSVQIHLHPKVSSKPISYPQINREYRSLIHEKIHRIYSVDLSRNEKFLPAFNYDLFFAATDTLLDVSKVLHAPANEMWPTAFHVGQLWMYGALNALAVQQDAALQLSNCFNHKPPEADKDALLKIKELRVAASGHPSQHNDNRLKIKGRTWLAHPSEPSSGRFYIASLKDFRDFVIREVDIPALIDEQRKIIEQNLGQIWKLIENDPLYNPPLMQDGLPE